MTGHADAHRLAGLQPITTATAPAVPSEPAPTAPIRESLSFETILTQRHPEVQETMKYFRGGHLPPAQRRIVSFCAELAEGMILNLPDGPQLTIGLQKLLEAKDCFVRQSLQRM